MPSHCPDADHETLEPRFGGKSFGKLSQGQYGGRSGLGDVWFATHVEVARSCKRKAGL